MNVLTHEPGAVLRSFYSTFSAKWSQVPDFDDEVDIHVTSCHTTPHTVPPLHDTTRHTTPRHATQHNTGHVTPRHTTARHTTPHHATGTGVHIGCAWVCMGVHGCAWVCMGAYGCACHVTFRYATPRQQDAVRRFKSDREGLNEAIVVYMNQFFAVINGSSGRSSTALTHKHTHTRTHAHTRTHTHTHTVTYTVTHKVRHTHIHTHTHTHTHTHAHAHTTKIKRTRTHTHTTHTHARARTHTHSTHTHTHRNQIVQWFDEKVLVRVSSKTSAHNTSYQSSRTHIQQQTK